VLWRKMFRDIWNNKGSYLACLVLVIMGLLLFTAFSIASDNLGLSQQDFYEDQNFAHGFAEIISMPYRDVERLSEIEGIDQVSGGQKAGQGDQAGRRCRSLPGACFHGPGRSGTGE